MEFFPSRNCYFIPYETAIATFIFIFRTFWRIAHKRPKKGAIFLPIFSKKDFHFVSNIVIMQVCKGVNFLHGS